MDLEETVSKMRGEGVYFDRERLDYLIEEANLRKPKAVTIILCENGYSHSGVAKIVDVTEQTAKKYFDQLEEEYGEEVLNTHPKPEVVDELWPNGYKNPL